MQSKCFVCRLCLVYAQLVVNWSTGDIDNDSCVEIVDVCYLVDISVDGDADAAVTARICSGCFKFRSCGWGQGYV